jgi:hypothetical protein
MTAATLLMGIWAVFPAPAGAVFPGVDGNCSTAGGTTINPGGSATIGGVTVSLSMSSITISGGSANVCVKAGDCNSGVISLGAGTHNLSGIIEWRAGNDCDVAGPPFPGVSHIVVYGTTSTSPPTTQTTTTETTTTETTTTETTTSQTTTPGTTTSPGTTVSGTSVTPPESSSTPPQGTTVSGTTVKPGGTAFTGIEDVVPLGAIALMLMTGGSGLMWAGSRRRRNDERDEEE